MYEGEKKKDVLFKLFSYGGQKFKKKNADGISFSTAVQILFILF